MHLARLWREGSPERQLVALSAELRRSGLLLKNTRDSPYLSKLTKSIHLLLRYILAYLVMKVHSPEDFYLERR